MRLGSLPQPPSATNLAVNQGDYCLMPLVPIFSWTFSDPNLPLDSQSAYQVLVDNNSDFSSPEINTNKVINSGQQYSPPPGLLSYSTTYYWKVTVWDSTDLSATTNGPNFTTPLHRYPNPSFMVIPQWPTKDEVVLFSDNSLCYDNANSSYSCKNGGSISYRWDFSYVSPTFVQDSTKKGNASTTYAALGNYTVRLEITDSSLSPAGVCVTDQVVNVGLPLPFWKEVAP